MKDMLHSGKFKVQLLTASTRVVTGLKSGLNGVGFISNVGIRADKSLFGVDRVRC